MEGLAALFAVPESGPLVDRVMADDALLAALGERLDEEDALLGQVFKLVQEVAIVILYLGLLLSVAIATTSIELEFVLCIDLATLVVAEELSRAAKVLELTLALLIVKLLAALVLRAGLHHTLCSWNLDIALLLDKLVCFGVIGRFVVALLLEKVTLPSLAVSGLGSSLRRLLALTGAASSTATSAMVVVVTAHANFGFVLRIDAVGQAVPATSTAASSTSSTAFTVILVMVATASSSAASASVATTVVSIAVGGLAVRDELRYIWVHPFLGASIFGCISVIAGTTSAIAPISVGFRSICSVFFLRRLCVCCSHWSLLSKLR